MDKQIGKQTWTGNSKTKKQKKSRKNSGKETVGNQYFKAK